MNIKIEDVLGGGEVENLIEPPEGGWKEKTWYLVDVAFRPSNPVHRAVLAVGFMHDDGPGAYTFLYNPSYDMPERFEHIYYLRVVREILGPDGMESSYKMPPKQKS